MSVDSPQIPLMSHASSSGKAHVKLVLPALSAMIWLAQTIMSASTLQR